MQREDGYCDSCKKHAEEFQKKFRIDKEEK
jgi:hypothetical protein